MDATHPLGVETGEVVVDRDEVHAVAGQRVEVGRQRRHEGLALAGLHLGDPTEVERRPAHQLHVEVALADHPSAASRVTANASISDVVELGAVGESLPELVRLGPQGVVGQLLDLRLERVDVGDDALEGLELLALAGAEDAIEDAHAAVQPTGPTRIDVGRDTRLRW